MILNIDGIKDEVLRENFLKLSQLLRSNFFLAGEFKLIEETVTKPSLNYRIKHHLGFAPRDIWLTWVSDGAAVEILYTKTDANYITLNVPQKCRLRLVVGAVI